MSPNAYLAVRNRSSVTRVPLEKILYIMREKRKLCVVCSGERYEYYESISKVAPLFGKEFFRVNDGCFINLDLIDRVEGETVFFFGGECLMLSRDAAVKCKQRFYIYIKTGEQYMAGEMRGETESGVKNTLDKSLSGQYNQ